MPVFAILSDTHHLLRPEVMPHLRGVDGILHAGDIGDIRILDTLRTLAPTIAIRGNIDTSGATAALPAIEARELAGQLVYMLHSLSDLDLNPQAATIAVVISGHTHQPQIETRNGVLFLNPGSCGPRRFSLPVTMAMLTLEPGVAPHASLIDLNPPR